MIYYIIIVNNIFHHGLKAHKTFKISVIFKCVAKFTSSLFKKCVFKYKYLQNIPQLNTTLLQKLYANFEMLTVPNG